MPVSYTAKDQHVVGITHPHPASLSAEGNKLDGCRIKNKQTNLKRDHLQPGDTA